MARGQNSGIPQPITVASKKIHFPGLAAAYEWMPVDPFKGFEMAFAWFKANEVALLQGNRMTPDLIKVRDRAVKTKEQGDRGATPGEQIAGWTMTIRAFEKIYAHHNLPKVDEALSAVPSSKMTFIPETLAALNTVFAGFVMYSLSPAGRGYDVDKKQIVVSGQELMGLSCMGALQMALSEAPKVAMTISHVNGQLDGATFIANLPKVLDAIGAQAPSSKRVAKVQVPGTVTSATPRTPAAPRTAGPRSTSPVKPGSDLEKILNMIQSGQGPTIQDIVTAMGASWHYHKVTMAISNLRCKAGINFNRVKGRYFIA